MIEESIHQLSDCCGVAREDLVRLNDQVAKVIEAKKKASDADGGAGSMMLRQAEDALKTLENLKNIGSKLPGAVEAVKGLCQQAELLLGSTVTLKHSSPVLARGGFSGHEKHEK